MARTLTALAFSLAFAGCAAPPPREWLVARCEVTDGDTIRCGDERIRLLAIDAPELPGHCRAGRECVAGDPFTSTDSLRQIMGQGPLTIRRFGVDRYGRTLAMVSAGRTDLSCAQIERGHAEYVRRWDNDGAVARTCPDAVAE